MVCAAARRLKAMAGRADEPGMTAIRTPAVHYDRPHAPWLVAGGIVGAITVAMSCLVILI